MAGDLIDKVLHDTHRVLRRIGRGGMGDVYEAVHVRLRNSRFAIKVLHQRLVEDDNSYARFKREAEIASGTGHPNIAFVTDFYETDEGQPCMVMEYLEGHDLGQHLRRVKRMTPAQLVPVVEQVGSALQAVHDSGIVHRDMKPANIFLMKSDGEQRVKVLDFGISKIRDSSTQLTGDMALMGTPHYMSPEQGEGQVKDVDHRTDIFALGTICYVALAGSYPFDAPTMPGVLHKICYLEPTPLGNYAPGISRQIQEVLLRALAKKKEDRYQQARDFVADFCRAVEADADSTAAADAATTTEVPLATLHPGAAPESHSGETANLPALDQTGPGADDHLSPPTIPDAAGQQVPPITDPQEAPPVTDVLEHESELFTGARHTGAMALAGQSVEAGPQIPQADPVPPVRKPAVPRQTGPQAPLAPPLPASAEPAPYVPPPPAAAAPLHSLPTGETQHSPGYGTVDQSVLDPSLDTSHVQAVPGVTTLSEAMGETPLRPQAAAPHAGRLGWVALAAVSLLSLGGAGLYLALRSPAEDASTGTGTMVVAASGGPAPPAEQTTASPEPAPPVDPASPKPPPAKPALPDLVRIRLQLVPAGATVLLDGVVRTDNPLVLRRSGTPRQLRVTASGYQAATRMIVASADRAVSVKLARPGRPRGTRRPPPRTAAPVRSKPAGRATTPQAPPGARPRKHPPDKQPVRRAPAPKKENKKKFFLDL